MGSTLEGGAKIPSISCQDSQRKFPFKNHAKSTKSGEQQHPLLCCTRKEEAHYKVVGMQLQ